MSAIETLRAAQASVDKGDHATALSLLLSAWRETPDPALADAIDVVGELAGASHEFPVARTDGEREKRWHKIAAQRDPAAIGPLLDAIADAKHHSISTISKRLLVLVEPNDPRVAKKLCDLLCESSPVAYLDWSSAWRPLFVALATCGDPRIADRGDAIREVWTKHSRRSRWTSVHKSVPKLLDAAFAAIPKRRPKLDKASLAITMAIARARREADDDRATEAALLAAVYANPTDDGPRAIYADWLLERSDPRGEFISLQLANKKSTKDREYSLAELHRIAWEGSLAPHIADYMYVDWSRGFLQYAPLVTDKQPPDLAWSTLERVHGGIPAHDDAPMPVLTVASEVPMEAIARLAKLAKPPPLVELEVAPSGTRKKVLATLATLRLPALASLDFGGDQPKLAPADLAALLAVGPIRKLGVTSTFASIPAWLAAAAPTSLEQLSIIDRPDYEKWRVTFERKSAGAFSVVAIETRSRYPGPICMLAGLLAQLPAGGISSIKIEVHKKAWSLPAREAVAAMLERHPKAKRTITGYTAPKR